MSVPNKTALVTGSTSGIGLATARALAKRGVNVVITGFGDENVISGIVDEMKGYGVRADYVPADLGKVADIETLCSEVTRLHPDGIDILISNAGLMRIDPIENMADSDCDLQIAVLLSASFHLIKRCLPAMKTKGWGRIVITSAALGVVGLTNGAVYTAAKHGVIGLAKGVALEGAAHGVTCNAVCPALVNTPLLEQAMGNLSIHIGASATDVMNDFIAMMPTGKLIDPEQVAELVEFLCLSNASSQITGAAYLIDGGYTAK